MLTTLATANYRSLRKLEEQRGCHRILLGKELGETHRVGVDELERPAWHWPSR
jgi:hypothetical protein